MKASSGRLTGRHRGLRSYQAWSSLGDRLASSSESSDNVSLTFVGTFSRAAAADDAVSAR